jgi:hypothetical protein
VLVGEQVPYSILVRLGRETNNKPLPIEMNPTYIRPIITWLESRMPPLPRMDAIQFILDDQDIWRLLCCFSGGSVLVVVVVGMLGCGSSFKLP